MGTPPEMGNRWDIHPIGLYRLPLQPPLPLKILLPSSFIPALYLFFLNPLMPKNTNWTRNRATLSNLSISVWNQSRSGDQRIRLFQLNRSLFGFPGASRIAVGRKQHWVSGKKRPARIEVRSSADRSLTFKEATSSIDNWRSNRHVKWKRSLTTSGLIEGIATYPFEIPLVSNTLMVLTVLKL